MSFYMNSNLIEQFSNIAKEQVPAGLSVEEWIRIYNEKLAKLIVEECCDLITKNEHSMVPGFMQRMSAHAEVSMLRKHFGLE